MAKCNVKRQIERFHNSLLKPTRWETLAKKLEQNLYWKFRLFPCFLTFALKLPLTQYCLLVRFKGKRKTRIKCLTLWTIESWVFFRLDIGLGQFIKSLILHNNVWRFLQTLKMWAKKQQSLPITAHLIFLAYLLQKIEVKRRNFLFGCVVAKYKKSKC